MEAARIAVSVPMTDSDVPPPGADPEMYPPLREESGVSRLAPLAAVSVVLGVASLPLFFLTYPASFVLAPLAIVLGHAAHLRVKSKAGRLHGRGLAIAGFTLGYISLAVTLGLFWLQKRGDAKLPAGPQPHADAPAEQ
jgi:hypothetical protein